ncbi:unnamed protein product [Paramecium octaurelia]|uniref:Transmembrane protein n=1 Tax=Paramecium octaurelia TaxID=43137 RepID=A0A8S1VRD0_PAROT|nr:unnamed protein product [Paramecium octaurelia]
MAKMKWRCTIFKFQNLQSASKIYQMIMGMQIFIHKGFLQIIKYDVIQIRLQIININVTIHFYARFQGFVDFLTPKHFKPTKSMILKAGFTKNGSYISKNLRLQQVLNLAIAVSIKSLLLNTPPLYMNKPFLLFLDTILQQRMLVLAMAAPYFIIVEYLIE